MFELELAGGEKAKRMQRTAALGSVSLALHFAALTAIWIAWLVTQHGNLQPPRVLAGLTIELPHLTAPQRAQSQSGSSGGNTDKLQPSFGQPPPRALKTLVLPTTSLQPKLALPISVNIDAPNVDATTIGDPYGIVGFPSLGPGDGNSIGGRPGEFIGDAGDSHIYTPGTLGVSTPVLLSKVEPEYTEEARRVKYSGTVKLRVIVDSKGIPRAIKVLQPLGLGLDERAIEAVRNWRFRPGTRNGHPVAVEATIEVNFRLL